MKYRSLCLIAGALLGLCAQRPAHAGTPATPAPAPAPAPSGLEAFFMQDYLLGDWGGARTDLANHGFAFEFFYIGTMPTNFHGGIDEGTEYQHALILALDVDFEKAGLWEGGRLYTSAVWLESTESFAAAHVGDLNKSNLVDFEEGFRLWEAYFQQNLFDDTLIFKAGIMSVDRDFILPDLYNSLSSITLTNQTFFYPTLAFNLYDIPGLPPGDHALPSSPYSSLGALVKWQPDPRFYIQGAVYDGNPDLGNNGTDIDLGDEQGALFYFEAGLRRNQQKGDTGLPGSLKVGGYYHTDEFVDVEDAIKGLFGLSAGDEVHDGNYGFYILGEQMLYREGAHDDPAQQGLVGFLRGAVAPSDRNLASWGVDGGLVWKGLIPSRDYDTLAIAGSYLRISDDIRDGQRAANSVLPGAFVVGDYEAVIELNYKAQIAAWWTLQPSLQYAMHPGGSSEIENAWVLVLTTTLRF